MQAISGQSPQQRGKREKKEVGLRKPSGALLGREGRRWHFGMRSQLNKGTEQSSRHCGMALFVVQHTLDEVGQDG